jgi:hypothetical protein
MKFLYTIFIISLFNTCDSHKVSSKNENINESKLFTDFFDKFSKDSIFQKKRVLFPLKYTSEEIEEGLVHETIDESKWYYIDFNKDKFANSLSEDAYSFEIIKKKDKVEYIRKGIDNGINVIFVFKLKDGRWYLTSVSDLST